MRALAGTTQHANGQPQPWHTYRAAWHGRLARQPLQQEAAAAEAIPRVGAQPAVCDLCADRRAGTVWGLGNHMAAVRAGAHSRSQAAHQQCARQGGSGPSASQPGTQEAGSHLPLPRVAQPVMLLQLVVGHGHLVGGRRGAAGLQETSTECCANGDPGCDLRLRCHMAEKDGLVQPARTLNHPAAVGAIPGAAAAKPSRCPPGLSGRPLLRPAAIALRAERGLVFRSRGLPANSSLSAGKRALTVQAPHRSRRCHPAPAS